MSLHIRTSWLSRGSRISGCASVLGSWQICHNVCTSLIVALATVGIAVQGMPLLFLNKLQWPLWIAAVALFAVLVLVRVGTRMRCITTRGVVGNAALLFAGLPFEGLWVSNARIAGLVIVLGVLLWYLKDLVVKKVGDNIVVDFVEHGGRITGGLVGVLAVVGLLVIASGAKQSPEIATSATGGLAMSESRSRMKFTIFDIAQAKELMDKNGDGKCDACGMDINQCITSGMMQCTMDPDAKIGLLGSQHIHARFTVSRANQVVDLSPFAHVMDAQGGGTGSSFIHVEGPNFNKLHMHATGVPLKFWFASVGLTADKAEVDVNGAAVPSGLEYIFKDGDDIAVKL